MQKQGFTQDVLAEWQKLGSKHLLLQKIVGADSNHEASVDPNGKWSDHDKSLFKSENLNKVKVIEL